MKNMYYNNDQLGFKKFTY